MFFIDFYRSLLLCFLQLIVQAAVAAVTSLVEDVNDAIESVAHTIGDGVDSAFDTANDASKMISYNMLQLIINYIE